MGQFDGRAKSARGGNAEHFWQKRYYDFNVRNQSQFVVIGHDHIAIDAASEAAPYALQASFEYFSGSGR